MRYTDSQRYDINSKNPYFSLVVSHIEGTNTYTTLNPFEDNFKALIAMAAEFRTAWAVEETQWTVWNNGRAEKSTWREVYFKTKKDAEKYLNSLSELKAYRWLSPRCYAWHGVWGKSYSRFSEPYQVLVRVQTRAR